MAKLKTDSQLSRRIVLAFLDFLDSVEPAPDVDVEGLEVARECLSDVFKLDPSSVDDLTKPGLLVNIFSSLETSAPHETKSDPSRESALGVSGPSTSSSQKAADADHSEASRSLGEDSTREPSSTVTEVSRDELFGKFFAALEKIHFFKTTPDGNDDQVQLDRATRIFDDAVAEMEGSRCQTFDQENLSDTLKSQGNKAMQSKLYSDAIELYSLAIALCENNAVYYCNRAAAYTQIQKYNEAVGDCLRSIEIDPNYSKAYSRLGFAYYAQGKYSDAINKGFTKALQLDPNNTAVKENIQVAEQKLREELQRRDQNWSSTQELPNQSAGGSGSRPAPPPFSAMPGVGGALPVDLTSMFMNLAAYARQQGRHPQEGHEEGNENGFDEPEIRMDGNINVNLGDQMPQNINLNLGDQMPAELSGALRSVMQMFTGAPGVSPPPPNSQDNNGRSEPNSSG